MAETGISGFTFVRDAVKLDYPIAESIQSILPVVDQFVVNLGDCSDNTLEVIESIGSPKIEIIHTRWNPDRFVRGATNADQTNIALDACTGNWCFYLQADEVVHEQDHVKILAAINKAAQRPDADGLLFHYNHFWGDYSRVHRGHNWYDREIRVIRNDEGIRSIRSAQSFRKNNDAKLRVLDSGAFIYHYGWVRHPSVMRRKTIALDSLHRSKEWVDKRHPEPGKPWDYGPLGRIPLFRGTHPAVMSRRIREKNWNAEDFTDIDNTPDHKHLRVSIRLLSSIERLIGRKIGGYSNWVVLPDQRQKTGKASI
jgi:glycosyltransferase involved in cell wall biosynthesis